MHSITYFCSPHLSSFCPDDGTCIGTETLVIKVFSTSEDFLKQEMDLSVPSHTGLYKVIKEICCHDSHQIFHS